MGGDSFLLELARRENRALSPDDGVEPGEVSVYMVIILPVFKVCLMDGVWPDDGTERDGCLAWQLYCL